MPPSPCRSNTERVAAIAAVAVALAGCPGDDAVCGAGDAPSAGVTVVGDGTTLSFGDFRIAPGGDCPAPNPPAGVVSQTMFGSQLTPDGAAVITLCLPRPDLIADGTTFALLPDTQPAGADDRVHVIDLQGALENGCRWTQLLDPPPTGTASFEGFCAQGTDPAGFAITFDGTVTVTETCAGAPPRELEVSLDGRVAVVTN